MNFFVKVTVALFLSLFIFGGVFSATIDRDNTQGTTYFTATSTNYDMRGAAGDPFVGRATSANYIFDFGLVMFVTSSNHCSDGIKNYDETGVDCGGVLCLACPNHCTNGIKDFDETGVDCGGALCTACGGGGGGGGGGGTPVLTATVKFSGIAYPGAKIFLLRDGILVTSFLSTSTGTFQYSLTSVSAGNFRYTLYAQDAYGGYSGSLSYPLTVVAGQSYHLSGIFISPTLYSDSQEVKRGDNINFYGYGAQNSTVILEIKSKATGAIINYQTLANISGNYSYVLSTLGLDEGTYEIKAKSKIGADESPFSYTLDFVVGIKTIEKPKPDSKCPQKGDVNGDCRVNLVDFSITAYWYKRTIDETFINTENTQLSGDGVITLVDFSILAYYWTG